MKLQILILGVGISIIVLFGSAWRADAAEVRSTARDACTQKEAWQFGASIGARARDGLQALLWGKTTPVEGFSEGIAARRIARDDEARALGEYWISRALFEARLTHIAFAGFGVIASRAPTAETAGIQLAALACLNRIHFRYPSLTLPANVSARLPALAAAANDTGKDTLRESALIELTALVGDAEAPLTRLSPRAERMLSLLRDAGPYEALGRGLWEARQGHHVATIASLRRFLEAPGLPRPLERYGDAAHLLIARAYYSTGQDDLAAAHFKQVERSSNELAESLSELAWAYLANARYPETIGTTMSLQAGGLRRTFEPEAPMVMAMAMNELCQYPESIRATQLFRKTYESSFRWLSSWREKGSPLYPLAADFVRKRASVPERIGSEWVRSPIFISSQEEINLLFTEKGLTADLGRSGARRQRELGQGILELARDLKPRLVIARMKRQAGDSLPPRIREDLARLRELARLYRGLQAAAPVWHAVLASHRRQAQLAEARLVARINHDLDSRSRRMATQLEEIAENIQLIEVEIYNGASQDIIWQNAHPDYRKVAEGMRDSGRRNPAKVWDWGRMSSGSEEGAEIWEDELGSFKANLFDNCSSKDRYLALTFHPGAKN